MHICMFIWFYTIPFGLRRQMEERDIEYRNQLKFQTNSNGYFGKKNSKEKFSLLNMIIKDENETTKEPTAHL